MCLCVWSVLSPQVVFRCRGCSELVRVFPVAFLCGAVSTKYFQWCSSVPCNILWVVAQWYPSVNQSSIGYFFGSPLRCAVQNGGPSASGRHLGWPHSEVIQDGDRKRKGRHFAPRTAMGIQKSTPGPGWRHFRRRHLGSKMATAEMTSGGRRDAREDVLQTSAPSMSPVEVWLYLDLKSIWSLASPRHYPSDWVSCPLATTRKWSVCTCQKLWKTFDFSKLLLYFFFIIFF